MLINFSNHPTGDWSESQIAMAKGAFGTLVDVPFPAVDPGAHECEIDQMAADYFSRLTTMLDECANEPCANAVHIQGEFTFVFRLVTLLKASGIRCIASTSLRNVVFQESGEKIVKFDFVGFRDY